MSDNHKRKERQGSTTGSSTERYLGGSVAIDQDPSRGKRRGLHGLKVLTTLYGVEKKSESYELRVPQPDGTVRKLPACHGLSIGGLAECGDEELQERIPDKIDVGMRAIVRGRGDNFAIVHALAFLPSLRSDGLGGGKMPRVLFGHVDDKGNDENKLYQAAIDEECLLWMKDYDADAAIKAIISKKFKALNRKTDDVPIPAPALLPQVLEKHGKKLKDLNLCKPTSKQPSKRPKSTNGDKDENGSSSPMEQD